MEFATAAAARPRARGGQQPRRPLARARRAGRQGRRARMRAPPRGGGRSTPTRSRGPLRRPPPRARVRPRADKPSTGRRSSGSGGGTRRWRCSAGSGRSRGRTHDWSSLGYAARYLALLHRGETTSAPPRAIEDHRDGGHPGPRALASSTRAAAWEDPQTASPGRSRTTKTFHALPVACAVRRTEAPPRGCSPIRPRHRAPRSPGPAEHSTRQRSRVTTPRSPPRRRSRRAAHRRPHRRRQPPPPSTTKLPGSEAGARDPPSRSPSPSSTPTTQASATTSRTPPATRGHSGAWRRSSPRAPSGQLTSTARATGRGSPSRCRTSTQRGRARRRRARAADGALSIGPRSRQTCLRVTVSTGVADAVQPDASATPSLPPAGRSTGQADRAQPGVPRGGLARVGSARSDGAPRRAAGANRRGGRRGPRLRARSPALPRPREGGERAGGGR